MCTKTFDLNDANLKQRGNKSFPLSPTFSCRNLSTRYMTLHENTKKACMETLSYSSHTPHLHATWTRSWYSLLQEDWKNKWKTFSQPVKLSSVTQSAGNTFNLSVSLPCSDVTAVIVTGPVVPLFDWMSPTVQTRFTSMAGKGNQPPHCHSWNIDFLHLFLPVCWLSCCLSLSVLSPRLV